MSVSHGDWEMSCLQQMSTHRKCVNMFLRKNSDYLQYLASQPVLVSCTRCPFSEIESGGGAGGGSNGGDGGGGSGDGFK